MPKRSDEWLLQGPPPSTPADRPDFVDQAHVWQREPDWILMPRAYRRQILCETCLHPADQPHDPTTRSEIVADPGRREPFRYGENE